MTSRATQGASRLRRLARCPQRLRRDGAEPLASCAGDVKAWLE